MPLPGFVAAVNEAFPEKGQKFVVGCLSGARSEKAVALLAAVGRESHGGGDPGPDSDLARSAGRFGRSAVG